MYKKRIIITLIIFIGVLSTTIYFNQKEKVKALENANQSIEKDLLNYKHQRLINVKGNLYYDTGEYSTIKARCGVMDGKITSHIDSKYIPTENNQSNFEGDYDYQYGEYGTIDVVIDGKWITFKPINQTIDFLDDNFKIELIQNDTKSIKGIEYYTNSEKQKIYLVNLDEIYLIDSNNKLTLKEYIEKEQITIDQPINYITNKIEYITGLYDGGTTIYRDGGSKSNKNNEPKVSNTGFTIIRCHKGNNDFTNYNTDVYIGPKDLKEDIGFRNGYCGH